LLVIVVPMTVRALAVLAEVFVYFPDGTVELG